MQIEFTAEVINKIAEKVHNANAKWWVDINTGEPVHRNVGEMLMLTVSELAEASTDTPVYDILLMQTTKALCRAMEGHRKDLMDDKLPHRKMVEVELADAMIRIMDMAAGLGFDLGGAFVEKMAFNTKREDHTLAHRLAEGGKKY